MQKSIRKVCFLLSILLLPVSPAQTSMQDFFKVLTVTAFGVGVVITYMLLSNQDADREYEDFYKNYTENNNFTSKEQDKSKTNNNVKTGGQNNRADQYRDQTNFKS